MAEAKATTKMDASSLKASVVAAMADDAEDSDPMDSDIEEADIEAMARSSLAPNEQILGEGVAPDKVESRGICNAPVLRLKAKELELKTPDGAKRVPWVDSMCIDGQQEIGKEFGPKDGNRLEGRFMNLAADAVKEAYRRLKVMRIPCTRPVDFFAEMLKTDKQMYMVRQRASEESRRIKIVDERKKHQAAKKFSKKAKTSKLKQRADDKKQTLTNIEKWKKSNEKDNEDERDLEDILNKRGADQTQDEDKGRGQKPKNLPMKSVKRKAADEKFGHGGRKRFAKSNTLDSVNDFSDSPWASMRKKGKGGGKGKDKGKGGGKGKSKGKKTPKASGRNNMKSKIGKKKK